MRKNGTQTLPHLNADVVRLVDDLEKETDRGVALLGAAFLDDVLDVMIRGALVNDEEAINKLCGTGRPLESFGARTHMAYCVGLLGQDIYHDLNLIREIRNDFAHRQPTHFGLQEIKDKCGQLECISCMMPDKATHGRERFIASVVLIANHLMIVTSKQRRAVPAQSFSENGYLRLR